MPSLARLLLLTMLAIAGTAVVSGTARADASFTPLPYKDFNATDIFASEVNGVSADGRIAVGASSRNFAQDAVRWVDGAIVELPGSTYSTVATAITPDGSTIVGHNIYGYEPQYRIWHDGESHSLMSYAYCIEGGGPERLWGVSDDGQYAVLTMARQEVPSPPICYVGSVAFLMQWSTPDGDYLTPPPPPSSIGYDANQDGRLVLGWQSDLHAVVWDLSGPSLVTTDLPGASPTAYAITGDGVVKVGESGAAAVRWVGTTLEPLGSLGGTGVDAARASTPDGSVIVGVAHQGSNPRAFVWSATRGMHDIQTLLEDAGLDLTGWTLEGATGVSSDGRTVVGNGTNPSGDPQAWLATLPEARFVPTVPAFSPSGLALLVAALAALGVRRALANG